MQDWEPTPEDMAEAQRFWAVCDAMDMGPEVLAKELVQQDPGFAVLLMEFLEREMVLENSNEINDLVRPENLAKSAG